MTSLLALAKRIHDKHASDKEWLKDSENIRAESLLAIKEMFSVEPEPETVIYDFISLLLVLPVHDRLHVQRAMRPLAQKMERTSYLSNLSRALQETDAWVDLNILSDKGRRSLPDMGLEINPEFKLP